MNRVGSYFIAFLIGLFIVEGCNSKEQAEIETLSAFEQGICLDSIRFEFGYNTEENIHKSGMTKIFLSFNYLDTTYLASDNLKFGKIIVYSLTHPVRKIVYDYPTQFEFEDDKLLEFRSPYEFFILSGEGVFYHYKNGAYSEPVDLNQSKLLTENGLWINRFMGYHLQEFRLIDSSRLLIPITPNLSKIAYSKEAFAGNPFPVSATYDLITEELSILPFMYPQELIDNNFGNRNFLRQYHKNADTAIYYAECFPYIYLCVNGLTKKIQCKSKFQVDSIRPLPYKSTSATQEKDFIHAQQSGHYSRIVYDQYRNCYYRIFTLPLAEKRVDGYYNTFWDARNSVMILDSKFEVLGEYLLPYGAYSVFIAGVSKEGFIINKKYGIRNINNGFEFYRLRINCAN